jgi:hypothetical protein
MLLDGALIPPAILKDPTLSAGARLLWGMLAEYQGKRVECFPLEETLAGFLGVKVRQFQSYLKELENYTRKDPPEPFPLIKVKRVWADCHYQRTGGLLDAPAPDDAGLYAS